MLGSVADICEHDSETPLPAGQPLTSQSKLYGIRETNRGFVFILKLLCATEVEKYINYTCK
jgi:hypothetical protein